MSEMGSNEEHGKDLNNMRKLRVLCLHGFRTSASFLHKQISKWDSSITEKLDMSFLDGPFPAGGKSDIEGIFPPPYYEWFQFNKDFTEYTNLDKGLSFIVEYMEKNGPFDGLLGFSQGAVLSAALVGFQMKGVVLKNYPPIRFVICISGSKFKEPSLCELAYSQPIKCPSVHLIGAKDWLKEPGEELMQAFENPLLIRHPQGHTVPRLDGEAVNLLNRFIDGFETTDITHKQENEHIIENSGEKSVEIDQFKVENNSRKELINGLIQMPAQGSLEVLQ
eukprot:Gb_39255 [translate_table: standard]